MYVDDFEMLLIGSILIPFIFNIIWKSMGEKSEKGERALRIAISLLIWVALISLGIALNNSFRVINSGIFNVNVQGKEAAKEARKASLKADLAIDNAENIVNRAVDKHNEGISTLNEVIKMLYAQVEQPMPIVDIDYFYKYGDFDDIDVDGIYYIKNHLQLLENNTGINISEIHKVFDSIKEEYPDYAIMNVGAERVSINSDLSPDVTYNGLYFGSYNNDNEFNGYGIMYWDEHEEIAYCAGYWNDGSCSYGVRLNKDGSYYTGRFYDEVFVKYGKFKLTNGDIYIGQWKDDVISGNGVFYFSGDWDADIVLRQDYDVYIDAVHYIGEVKNGKPTGEGIISYKSGCYYEGEVFEYKRDGYGTLYNADGEVIKQGYWKEDSHRKSY